MNGRPGGAQPPGYDRRVVGDAQAPELDLRRHLWALQRRWKVIALVVLGLAGSTLLASVRQEPLYEGTAKLLLKPTSEALLTGGSSQDEVGAARRVSNEIEVFKTAELRGVVQAQLGPHRRVGVSQVGDTDVLAVKGRSSSPKRAAAVARAYAVAYIDLRRGQEAAALSAAAGRLRSRVADLQAQIDAVNGRIEAGERQRQDSAAGVAAPSQPIAGLSAERDHLLTEQAPLKQRLDQLELEADATTGGVALVSGEVIPVVKVQPRPLRNTVVALTLGLLLGFGLAFLLAYLDDSVKVREDIERAVPGLPVLTLVPHVPDKRRSARPLAVTLTDPTSPGGESFSRLRTSLQFLKTRRAPQIFQVTSARAAEGKTSVAANLAVVLARSGHRVVAVDCDLRRPSLHEAFGLSSELGFTSVFIKDVELGAALQRVPQIEGLSLLAAGPVPPNAAEVLSARQTAEILAALQAKFEAVVIDSPPTLPVTDPVALSAWVDATIVVARAGRTTRRDLARTVELMSHAEAPLVGVVLNDAPAESGYDYRYQYRQVAEVSRVPAGDGDGAASESRHLRRPAGERRETLDRPAGLPHSGL